MAGELQNFEQAQQRFNELTGRYRQGAMSPQDYHAQVAALRVIDQRGVTWQPDPAGGGWLYWDGARWLPGQPFPPAAPRPQSGEPAGKHRRARGVLNLSGRTGDGRRIPLKQRSRFWWDALSVWAGLVVGLVWFAYSAVRGMPQLAALNLSRESVLDFLPSLVILAVPIGLFILRRTVLARLNLLLLKLNSWETGRKVGLVAGIVAGAWVLGEAVGWAVQASRLFNIREQLDLATPVAMIVIPLMLVLFRRETDGWLRPLQGVLKHIPKLLLTLVALAVPYLLGYYLYTRGGMGQYQLLKWNVILGILISYVLLRTPQTGGVPSRPVPGAALLGLITTAGWVLWEIFGDAHPAYADDFLRDPFNLKDGLRTNGVAPVLSGTAAELGILGVNGTEILRNMTGASGDGGGGGDQSTDRTRLLSGDRAIKWLRDNNFIDGNNNFTPEFNRWWDRLPSEHNPTDLQGIAGEFDPAGGQLPDDLTIAIKDPDQPPLTDDGGDQRSGGSDPGDDSSTGDDTGAGDGDKKPEDPKPPEKQPDKTPPPPPPPPDKAPEPPKPEPEKQPDQAPPPPPPKDKTPDKLDIKIDPGILKFPDGINPDDLIQCAGMLGAKGGSLDDVIKWLHRQGDRIRYPFEWFADWYRNTWLPLAEGTKITDKHRLPDHIKERGLFDTSRDSGLSRGLRQTMINAGVDPRVADEVLKRIEAEGAEDARIARLANSLLRSIRAINQGAQALPQGTKGAAGAAAAWDAKGPDATAFVERLVLTQQSNYDDAYNNWRDTQDMQRYASTGAGVTGPKTQQDVDRLIKDLQAEQRSIKKSLGYDMKKMQADEKMRQLWREEKALKDLKKQCADLNLIRRLQK